MKKKFIKLREASELLSLSPSTIYKMTMAKTIPFYKPGGRLLFCPDELVEYVKNSKCKTIDENYNDAFLITSLAA